MSTLDVTDTTDHKMVRAAVNVFMVLVYSPQTHQYLVKQEILECVQTVSMMHNGQDFYYSRYHCLT